MEVLIRRIERGCPGWMDGICRRHEKRSRGERVGRRSRQAGRQKPSLTETEAETVRLRHLNLRWQREKAKKSERLEGRSREIKIDAEGG